MEQNLPQEATNGNTKFSQTVSSQNVLDPLSENFDSLAALQASSLPGLPFVQPLASVSQFEEYQVNPQLFTQKQDERKLKDDLKKTAKSKAAQDLEPAKPTPKRNTKNVLTRMEDVLGPRLSLKRWVQSRSKVKVITRSFRGIRGTCTGFIVAFDKYLNLAMVDVDEIYSSIQRPADKPKPTRGQSKKFQEAASAENEKANLPAVSDPEVDLLVRRVESLHMKSGTNIKRRHLNQLFIRGDNVVSISRC